MQQRSSIRILAGLLWVVLYSLTMVQGLINLHIAATRDSQSSQCLDSFSKLPHAVGQSADTASRTLLQHAPAPAPLGLLGLSATGNAQIPVKIILQVTCPFVVPFNQASQVLIGNSLQYVFPPNTTLVSTDMQEQINDDTVTVACSFVIWQSMIPILLANRCCALEVLYLQHAVERVMPEAIGQNVSMTLIGWQIGSMRNAPAGAPALAPASSTTASSVNGTTSTSSYVYPVVIPATPLYIGGVDSATPAVQAQANYTVVDIFVRTIASGKADMSDLPANLSLALAHRHAMKSLVYFMGIQLEVLDMQDSANISTVPSVDFLNRLWVPSSQLPLQNVTAAMWRLAARVQLQYAQLMNATGYNVQLDVLNATVSGLLQNSSLPAIQVAPPTSPIDPNPSGLLMTLAIESESLMPFNDTKRWIVTGVLAQVLQQYGADFVSIQAVNTSTSTTVAARRLLTHSVTPEGAARRHLTQAGSSMLQISTLVTAPAEDQLQMLSPLCASKIAQSLGASGYPSTVTLASAEPASGGPFSPAVALANDASQGTGGSGTGGGLSRGKKAAAIAVPVILGSLLAVAAAGVLLFLKNKKSRKGAQSNKAVVEKGVPKLAIGDLKAEEEGGKPAQAVMDTAMRLQSTGGADSYQKLGADIYETDMSDDKYTISMASSPERPQTRSLQDSGLNIQATQAGAVRRVLSRMHAREQELSNALAETSTFAMHHLQAGSIFRKKYSLTGARWRSPRAVWCAADQVQEPWGPVALKMYALTSDFIREKELLDMPYSSEHWPKVYDTYTYSDVGFDGDACPPCIVMQPPLTTLQTWMDTQDRIDMVWEEQVATLYNLCKALQSFHSRGMVHCSLSPPDFSWYQGGQGWKVASCGDWAQQGMHVRSCYALRYASPEAVQGDLFDVAGAAADPAIDMWAVGAIAFEILTGQAYFSRQAYSDSDIISMLLGFEPLPSESQPAFWHRIREPAAQRLVQNLLRRMPGQRSTINEVLASPIFNMFTQPHTARKLSRRSLWSKDFVSKLTTTASSLRSTDSRWSDEAAEMQQTPSRAGPPPSDAQDKESLRTNRGPPSRVNPQRQAALASRPFAGIDAQDKESLHSRESQQSKPPSIVDTQEKDSTLQSQHSSVLTTQEKAFM